MADEAKRVRATAKGTSTRANNRVINALEAKLDVEIIRERFELAAKQWEVVMEKSEEYNQVKYVQMDLEVPPDEEQWYQEVAAAFEAIEIKYHDYMKGRAEPERVEMREQQQGVDKVDQIPSKGAGQSVITQRMHGFEGRTLTVMMKELEGVVNNANSTEPVIKAYEQDVREQLTKVRNSQREVIREGGESDISCLESEFARLAVEVGRRIEELAKNKETKGKCQMKLERVKLPSFCGAIREYPRFKKDFEAQVEPNIEKKAIPYVLKSCLSGEALDVVKNVDDDPVKMWERLREKYGRPSKVTDAIMIEIKRMKQVNEGDDRKFTEMVELVESSWRDLRMIGMESEISNTTVVSFIEEKLPRSVKAQWCLEVCEEDEEESDGGEGNTRATDKGKFEMFLRFLLKHKRAIEYGSEQIRTPGFQRTGLTHAMQGRETNTTKENCWIHTGIPNGLHPIWRCREFLAKTVKDRITFVKEHEACRACLLKKCPGAKDPMQCKTAFKCFEAGCRQPHNHLLHESQEITGSTMHASTYNGSQQTMLPLQSI